MKNKYSIFSLIKNAFSYHENWEKAWKDPEPKKEYDVVIIGGGRSVLGVWAQDVCVFWCTQLTSPHAISGPQIHRVWRLQRPTW